MKVDRSLVATIGSSRESAIIVKTVMDLAHNLSLLAVAEGVEDQRVMDQLETWGCDLAQGFHICRPLPVQQLSDYLAERA